MGKYTDYQPKNLEPVQVTPEMITFLQNLDKLLKEQAQFNSARPDDRVRLKGYMEDTNHPGTFVEVDILKDWDFVKNNEGKWDFTLETSFPHNNQLSEFENEMASNKFAIRSVITEFNTANPRMEYRLQVRCLMDLAKSGSLFVTKPGELVKDSHPIVLQENGELSLKPSLKDYPAEEKTTEPFLLAQQKLQSSPHYEDQQYASQIQQAEAQLSTYVLKGVPNSIGGVMSSLVSEAHEKQITRASFIQQLEKMPWPASQNMNAIYQQARANDPTLPNLQLTLPSRSVSGQAALAKKAFLAFSTSLYDLMSVDEPLKIAAAEGEFTLEEYRDIKQSRDTFTLLLDFEPNAETHRSNIDSVKMMMGKGLDPQDPHYQEDKQRMFAQYVNKRLKEITEFDYEKYAHLSDQEFVDQYMDFNPAFHRVSIMKKELDEIRSNPYLDQKLLKKCYKIADKYTNTHYYNQCRIRLMSNPYYGKYQLKPLETLDDSSFQQIGFEDYSEELTFDKCITDLSGLRESKNAMLADYIRQDMLTSKKAEREGHIVFYNASGQKINELQVANSVNKGELIFAANIYNKEQLTAYQIHKETFAVTSVPITRKYQSMVNTIHQNIDQIIAQTPTSLENLFYTPQRLMVEAHNSVCREIVRKNLNPDLVWNKISKFNQADNDRYTQGEFCYLFEKQGLHPAHLSFQETQARYEKTSAANKANFDFTLSMNQAFHISNEGEVPFEVPRFFYYFMFDYQGNAKEYNENVVRRFNEGEASRKEVLQEAVNRHFANEELYNRDLTDEELIKNWSKIRSTGLAIGLEYINFKEMMEKGGVPLEEATAKRLDAFHEVVSLKHSVLAARMSLLMNRYYKYGADEVLTNAVSSFAMGPLSDDPAFIDFANSKANLIMHENNLIGCFLKKQPTGASAVVAFNKDGQVLNGEQEIGQSLRDKKGVFFADAQLNLHGYQVQQMDKYPPVIENLEMNPDVQYAVDSYRIEHQDIPPYEKFCQLTILKEQYELNKLQPNDPDYQQKLKESLSSYCSALTIQHLIGKEGMEDNIKTSMGCEKTFQALKENLEKSSLIDSFMNQQLPHNPKEIAEMNPEKVYEKLMHARFEESAKQQQRWEKQRSEKVLSNTYDKCAKEVTFENFFQRITHEDAVHLAQQTPLSNLTLSRSSLQSITLSMMLSQGYSIEDALAPNAKADREMIGRAAMQCIQVGDYKTIVQNLTIGLNKLNQYVNQKLQGFDGLEPRYMLKPENKSLVLATILLKDFSQEITNAQKTIPKQNRIQSAIMNKITEKAEGLSMLAIFAGIRTHADGRENNPSTLLARYLQGDMLNKRYLYNRSLPGNQQKEIADLMPEEEIVATNIGYMEYMQDLKKFIPKTPEGKEELVHLIKTDTLHTKLKTRYVKEGDQVIYQNNLKELVQELDELAIDQNPNA